MQFQSKKSGGQLQYHGSEASLELGGHRIVVVHYDHHGYAMACTGDWDLVCCGHSHRAEVRRVADVKGGQSWLVNPGTVAGLAAPCTWVMADLAAMTFEVRELGRTGPPQ
jgi:predicted phosphodiesterase